MFNFQNFHFYKQCNGKQISWNQSLYLRDAGKGTGLSLVPKLNTEHTNLTAFSKMWVDLAVQVTWNFITIILC